MNDIENISTSVTATLENALEAFAEHVADKTTAQLAGLMPDIDAQGKAMSYQLQEINRQIEVFAASADLLENANQTNRLLSDQFYDQRIVQPMVRGLLPLWDLILSFRGKLKTTSSAAKVSLQYTRALQAQLKQFLAAYGVEAFQHESQTPFDAALMRPMRQIATTDETLHSRVAESLQCGFKINQRILRPETVSLYNLQHTLDSNQSNERKDNENVSTGN